MSIIYSLHLFVYSIKKFIKEQNAKEQNAKEQTPTIIIERQIGEKIHLGLSKNYSRNDGNSNSNGNDNENILNESTNESTNQLLLYENKYYYLERFNKQDKKLLYHWKNISEPIELVLLEFEHIQPSTINYKLIKNTNTNSNKNTNTNTNTNNQIILDEGYFNYKFFKPIGMNCTKEIDELGNLISNS